MKRVRLISCLASGTVVVALAVGSLGCSKKEGASNSAAASPVAADTNAPATAQDTAAPAPENTPVPVAISTVNVTDAKAAMDSANAAMRAKQYEEAAKLLIAIQAQQLSAQQAERAHAQMVQLQGALATALAEGDPAAKAAADALRASASGAGR